MLRRIFWILPGTEVAPAPVSDVLCRHRRLLLSDTHRERSWLRRNPVGRFPHPPGYFLTQIGRVELVQALDHRFQETPGGSILERPYPKLIWEIPAYTLDIALLCYQNLNKGLLNIIYVL